MQGKLDSTEGLVMLENVIEYHLVAYTDGKDDDKTNEIGAMPELRSVVSQPVMSCPITWTGLV